MGLIIERRQSFTANHSVDFSLRLLLNLWEKDHSKEEGIISRHSCISTS
jgi:hypothetical protein